MPFRIHFNNSYFKVIYKILKITLGMGWRDDAQDNTDHALACVWDANLWPVSHTHACRSALTHINSFGANVILNV